MSYCTAVKQYQGKLSSWIVQKSQRTSESKASGPLFAIWLEKFILTSQNNQIWYAYFGTTSIMINDQVPS